MLFPFLTIDCNYFTLQNDSLSAELPPPRPKRKPACFHYKKILAAIKAQRVNGDGVEVIIPNFDSKKALDQVGVMMNFKARYETYKVDADSNSSNENAGGNFIAAVFNLSRYDRLHGDVCSLQMLF